MIAAFDLSFTATGWAIWDCTHQIASGVFKSNAGQQPLERMVEISSTIVSMLDRAKFGLVEHDLVVLEGFAYGRANQAHQMGGLGYIVRLELQRRGLRYIEVAPSALKKFVSGSGNAAKDVMLKNVYKRFGFDTSDNNIADAVGLLYVGMALEGIWEPTTAEQREVIAQIKGGEKPKKRKKKEAA